MALWPPTVASFKCWKSELIAAPYVLCLICCPLADWIVHEICLIWKNLVEEQALDTRLQPLSSTSDLQSLRGLFKVFLSENCHQISICSPVSRISEAVLSQIPHSDSVTGCQLDIGLRVIPLYSNVRRLQCLHNHGQQWSVSIGQQTSDDGQVVRNKQVCLTAPAGNFTPTQLMEQMIV